MDSDHQEIWQKKIELNRLQDRANKLRQEIREEEQQKLQAKLRRLSPHQRHVFLTIYDYGYGYSKEDHLCHYRGVITSQSGLNKYQVGRALNALKRLGFVEYHRGLFNDDGEVAGSGYCVTPAGANWWKTVEKLANEPG